LDILEESSKCSLSHSDTLEVFCEKRRLKRKVNGDKLNLNDWTMDELYCLVVVWCQRHVHEEDRVDPVDLTDGGKKCLREITQEFQNIMKSYCPKDTDDMKNRLSDAQKYSRIDHTFNLDLLFDSRQNSDVESDIDKCSNLTFSQKNDHKKMLEPCRCCMRGFKALRRVYNPEEDERLTISSFVASLIFMQPSFFFDLCDNK